MRSTVKNKSVSFIGVGRLGLSFALLCDSVGYEVYGYDVSKERMKAIRDKTLKTSEPHIAELLKTNNMELCDTIEQAVAASDLIFILVATPSNPDGSYDHSQIESVIDELEPKFLRAPEKTIIVSCTVMPSYTKTISQRLRNSGITVLYSPEFVAQGNVVDGLRRADIILVGGEYNEDTKGIHVPEALFQLYRDIMTIPPVFKVLTHTGAELTKIGINCYLTLKTAYANYIGSVAINSGEEAHVNEILDAIGSDKRIGNKYLGYGFPASGVCLPRDVRAMDTYVDVLNEDPETTGLNESFMTNMIMANHLHLDYLFYQCLKKNPDEKVPFIFSHITYKPNVDIITESGPLELCLMLLRAGNKVNLPDKVIELDIPEELKQFINLGQVIFGKVDGYKVN